MEPAYSEWKPVINAFGHCENRHCTYCNSGTARMMKRFYTNRDGDTEAQFRVECPMCKSHGKTYMHESVAGISWDGMEHDPNYEDPTIKRWRMDMIRRGAK